MESDETAVQEPGGQTRSRVRIGPYLVTGRVALFRGVEILTASHDHQGARVILRRLLPLQGLPEEEASCRLRAFQDDTRRRQHVADPRHLQLFDFGVNPDGSAYQAFRFPDGFRSLPRDPRALPVEEWTRIAAEVGAALDSLLEAGIHLEGFEPTGLLIGPGGQVRLVPLAFDWPQRSQAEVVTRSLAAWLYGMLAGFEHPIDQPPPSLCDRNPRVSPQLDMTLRNALNPHASHATSTPGELARLLRSQEPAGTRAALPDAPEPPGTTNWGDVGAGAVLLALAGVIVGWLVALYLPAR